MSEQASNILAVSILVVALGTFFVFIFILNRRSGK